MNRRDAIKGIFGGVPVAGQQWQHKRNTRRHHVDTLLYRGPFVPPDDVAETIGQAVPVKTTARHLAARFASQDGTVWLGRCPVPMWSGNTGAVVGEIVRTPENRIRVHWWTAARNDSAYPLAMDIIARHRVSIMPPLPQGA